MIVSIAEIRSVQPYSTKPTHKHKKNNNNNNKQQKLQEKTEKEIGKATVMKKKNYWKMEEKE